MHRGRVAKPPNPFFFFQWDGHTLPHRVLCSPPGRAARLGGRLRDGSGLAGTRTGLNNRKVCVCCD